MTGGKRQQVLDELRLRLAVVNQCIEIFQMLRNQVAGPQPKRGPTGRTAPRTLGKRKSAEPISNNVVAIDSRLRS